MQDIAIRNLDYIFTVAVPSIMNTSPEILVNLERLLDEKSSEPWSQRRLPTMTATYPAVIDNDGEEDELSKLLRAWNCGKSASRSYGMSSSENFLQKDCKAEQAVSKQIRAARKKLQQIEILEAKQLAGHQLDNQQLAKLESRAAIEGELAELGVPVEASSRVSTVCPAEGRANRKLEVSKKQKRKDKLAAQSETPYVKTGAQQQISVKELPEALLVDVSAEKVRFCRVGTLMISI
jgi:inhibitor of Bruton tyrosine kinase